MNTNLVIVTSLIASLAAHKMAKSSIATLFDKVLLHTIAFTLFLSAIGLAYSEETYTTIHHGKIITTYSCPKGYELVDKRFCILYGYQPMPLAVKPLKRAKKRSKASVCRGMLNRGEL